MVEPRVDVKRGKILKPLDYKTASSLLEMRENKKKIKAQRKGIVYRDNVINNQLKLNEDEFTEIKKERERIRSKEDEIKSRKFQERVEKERRENIVTIDNAGESVVLEKKKYKK